MRKNLRSKPLRKTCAWQSVNLSVSKTKTKSSWVTVTSLMTHPRKSRKMLPTKTQPISIASSSLQIITTSAGQATIQIAWHAQILLLNLSTPVLNRKTFERSKKLWTASNRSRIRTAIEQGRKCCSLLKKQSLKRLACLSSSNIWKTNKRRSRPS